MHSVVLTVHNKGWMLEKVIQSIYSNTIGDYELVIVLDGCTDNSEEITFKNKNKRTKVFYADNVFETKANNIGLKNCQGERVIIVQDDMIINEHSWNINLEKPFIFDEVFAVTAKTAHNWDVDENLIIRDVDHADTSNTQRGTFAIRSCVNRGPLMIDHETLNKLNYLDEVYEPQVMDDHDLCYRAFIEYGKICGHYYVDFISDPSWGSTRKQNVSVPWFDGVYLKNKKIFYERYFKEIKEHRIIEDRNI